MKVALTVWEGRVSPVFDVCREALILDVRDGRLEAFPNQSFTGNDYRTRTQLLVENGVEILICGAISTEARMELQARAIRVIPFVAGSAEEVIASFAAGQFPDELFPMPGCGRRRGRRRRGACRSSNQFPGK